MTKTAHNLKLIYDLSCMYYKETDKQTNYIRSLYCIQTFFLEKLRNYCTDNIEESDMKRRNLKEGLRRYSPYSRGLYLEMFNSTLPILGGK